MRKLEWILGLIFACGLGSVAVTGTQAGSFDFSAIDKLWSIVSVLESDQEPADEAWDALVQTPGYAALIAHEPRYGLDFLKRNLRLVFKPSLAADLEKATRSASLRHFLDLKAKKDALKEFQTNIQNPSVWAEAVELLKVWLPPKAIEAAEVPPAAFIVFDKDARGGYGPLIFDFVYAYEQGGEFKALFAHEAFHYYRDKLAVIDSGNVRVAHGRILDVLDMIQNEGIADQIDKPTSIFEGGSRADSAYAKEFRKNMAESPRILGLLDELLCRLSASPQDFDRIASEMSRAVPQSGHPTGYFMARAVLDNGGKAELIRTFNNPFAFFYLFNAAALRNPDLPRLSNEALAVLRGLEKQYIPRPEEGPAKAAQFRGVDIAAVVLFGKIAQVLMKDEEPDPTLWESFFRNPGYRLLFAHESYSRNRLQELISMAFKPSRDADLKRELEGPGSAAVQHFLNHKKDLEAIILAAEKFRDGRILEEARARVQTLLPRKSRDILADASIHLIYFRNDLRFGYSAMLIDPLQMQAEPDKVANYVRMFLIWRAKDMLRPYDRSKLTQRQAAFLDGWEEIQHRGLADLLGREGGASANPGLAKRYEAGLKDVPRLLGEADKIMTRAAADPSAWREFETLSREFIVYPGCPAGYFIVAAIDEVLGREALAESTGNPPAFIRLYQKAAKQKGGLPVFSDKALAFLGRLEKEAVAAK